MNQLINEVRIYNFQTMDNSLLWLITVASHRNIDTCTWGPKILKILYFYNVSTKAHELITSCMLMNWLLFRLWQNWYETCWGSAPEVRVLAGFCCRCGCIRWHVSPSVDQHWYGLFITVDPIHKFNFLILEFNPLRPMIHHMIHAFPKCQ